jgi:hypothetical protein
MKQQRQPYKVNLSDLHARLYQILPEYPPVSAWTGENGTYKAVDAEGNVFLVDFERGEAGLRHEKRFFCDYQGLLAGSMIKTEPKRCDAGDNWGLTLLG